MSETAQKGYKTEDGIKEEAKKANMRTALLQRATLTGLGQQLMMARHAVER